MYVFLYVNMCVFMLTSRVHTFVSTALNQRNVSIKREDTCGFVLAVKASAVAREMWLLNKAL